jgi:6-pyruvoyl-tetrahydropterin synthase
MSKYDDTRLNMFLENIENYNPNEEIIQEGVLDKLKRVWQRAGMILAKRFRSYSSFKEGLFKHLDKNENIENTKEYEELKVNMQTVQDFFVGLREIGRTTLDAGNKAVEVLQKQRTGDDKPHLLNNTEVKLDRQAQQQYYKIMNNSVLFYDKVYNALYDELFPYEEVTVENIDKVNTYLKNEVFNRLFGDGMSALGKKMIFTLWKSVIRKNSSGIKEEMKEAVPYEESRGTLEDVLANIMLLSQKSGINERILSSVFYKVMDLGKTYRIIPDLKGLYNEILKRQKGSGSVDNAMGAFNKFIERYAKEGRGTNINIIDSIRRGIHTVGGGKEVEDDILASHEKNILSKRG